MSLFVKAAFDLIKSPNFLCVYKSAAFGRVLAIYMTLLLVEFGQSWLDSDSVEHKAMKHIRTRTLEGNFRSVYLQNVRILAF
jgi:hypothetical protein